MSSNRWNPMVEYFASKGWAVFSINYRGSIGYGRQYRDLLMKNWGVCDVEDCVAGKEYLQTKGIIDPQRTVIMGGSAGGYTTYLSLINYPGSFAAGISMCGVADLFMLNDETHLLERHYNDTLVGKLPEASKVFRERSPSYHASKIVDPLLILQGEIDTVVPKNQAELIKNSVKGYVEYHVYPGEGHMFIFIPKVMVQAFPVMLKFLYKHVLLAK